MKTFINFDLLKHPTNWLTIFFMLVLLGIAGHLFFSLFGVEPATGDTVSNGTQLAPGNVNGGNASVSE